MKRRMPTTFPFTANGVDYEAVLVEDPPASGWSNFNEVCSICSQPLGSIPFYTTVPFSFYVHANCAYSNAGRPPSPLDHDVVAPSTCLNISGNQTHHASRFVSGPFHPSSNHFYPTAPPAYNPYRCDPYYHHHPPPHQFPSHYHNHLPNHGYYHQYYSQFPYHIQQPPSYATGQFPPAPPHHQHDHRPSSFSSTSSTSSSSSLGWAGLAASTVLGSLLQALFSTMFSS